MYEFMAKFNPNNNCVKEFKYWIVCIREKQVTLGDAIILLKREVPSLADMTSDESAEFAEVLSWYEKKCVECFGAIKFNYIVAMMKDNFVHYHAFPRYSDSFEKYGVNWCDQDWPRLVQFRDVSYPREILDSIANDLRD